MSDRLDDETKPLYLQIADAIRSEIKEGTLIPGEQLPPMRRMAEERSVSLGTIRHVYALLEQDRLIECKRGQGTYDKKDEPDLLGRKDKALRFIDQTIESLLDLGFSTREAEIFFELRLRQREDAARPIRVAVVASTPEERSVISNSLENIGAARAYRISMNEVESQPERLLAGFDFIVAPQSLLLALRDRVPEHIPLMPAAMSISRKTVNACRVLPDGASVGVLTASFGFQDIIRQECADLTGRTQPMDFLKFGDPEKTRAFITAHDVIIVSPDYGELIDNQEIALLRGPFIEDKRVIRTAFSLDQGSLYYIGRAIERRYHELREFLLD